MFAFYVIMLLAFFAPGLMIPGVAQIWAVDLPLLLVLGWRLFIRPPQMSLEYKSYMQSKLLLPILLFMLWLALVTIMTLQASGDISILLILFSLAGRFRPVLFLFFCIPYGGDREKLYKMFNFLVILFFLQSVVIFLQKFNVSDINYLYSIKFAPVNAGDETIGMILSGHRTIGSIGNPNSVGTFMGILGIMGYSIYAFGQGIRRWLGLSMTILAFIICIFFAGTRQGTLAIILGCVVVSIIAFFLGKIGRLSFVALLIFLLSPLLTFYLLQDTYFFERFAILRGTVGIEDVGSFRARMELWPNFFSDYGGWVFIGKGMAGWIASRIWDSGWLMMIVAGGFPLAFIYLWWLMRVSWACFKTLPYRSNGPELMGFLLTGPGITFIVIITNIVNNTFNDTKISILIGLSYILSLGAAYELQYGAYASMELDDQELYFYNQDDSDSFSGAVGEEINDLCL